MMGERDGVRGEVPARIPLTPSLSPAKPGEIEKRRKGYIVDG